MDYKKLFSQYRNKLVFEGIIKALLCGLAVGAALSAVPAVITLAFNINGLVYSLIVLAGGTVAAAPIFYFALFRPTTKAVIHRVDRLGLEERVVTMMEFQKDDSYIAMAQREDAKNQLATRDRKSLKFSKFAMVPIMVALGVSLVLAGTIVPLNVISVEDPVAWGGGQYFVGREPTVVPTPPPVEYDFLTVSFTAAVMVQPTTRSYDLTQYELRDPPPGFLTPEVIQVPTLEALAIGFGGTVDGFTDQVVVHGGDAQTITAVSDPGFRLLGFFEYQYSPLYFVMDGRRIAPLLKVDGTHVAPWTPVGVAPDRGDDYSLTLTGVTGHREIFVLFEWADDGSGRGTGMPQDGEGDQPGLPGQGDPNPTDTDGPPDAGEGPWVDRVCHNTILDGETSYMALIEEHRDAAMQILLSGGELPPALRQLIERYFGTLYNFMRQQQQQQAPGG